jgi:hypothetical protein
VSSFSISLQPGYWKYEQRTSGSRLLEIVAAMYPRGKGWHIMASLEQNKQQPLQMKLANIADGTAL